MIRLRPSVLLLPPIERLFRNTNLPDHIGRRRAQPGLLQYRHNLFDRKALALHRKPPPG